MTTREKIATLRASVSIRRMLGYSGNLGELGRQLKASIYADLISKHPNATKPSLLRRMVRVVNKCINNP